ncbi:MAG TPA: glycosyltransferase family 2 protein [Candidatus Acidoferrum sp.]|nr:glycosyltransferase family 2 protein [Candidatus Acidoferrum sp.]
MNLPVFDEPNLIRYSIVVPLYNESANVGPLHAALTAVMGALGCAYECIFVDDGSTDETAELLEAIGAADDHVVLVQLRKNSGKSAALAAGFDTAAGRYVITMDGDLQHDAAEIPRFVAKLEEGYDIVCGRRAVRAEETWPQRVANRFANWLLAKLSGVPIHDFGGGFKAYRRDLVAGVPLYGELQRLIPIMALRRGGKICEVPVHIAPRQHGKSKYGMTQKLPFLFDLITVRFLTGYLSRPLHFFGTAGFFAMMAGSLAGLWLLAKKIFFGTAVMQEHGPLMFFAGVLFLCGVQLAALGLLGELQVRHYHDVYDWRGRYSVTRAQDRHENERTLRDQVRR